MTAVQDDDGASAAFGTDKIRPEQPKQHHTTYLSDSDYKHSVMLLTVAVGQHSIH